jgi:fibronectin-binding autotransporter adhesin
VEPQPTASVNSGYHRSLVAAAVGSFLIFAVSFAHATDRIWTGATNMTWGTSTNWNTTPPGGTSDNSVFNGTFTNQPNLGSTATAGGLWMTGSVGQNVTVSGSTLTLQGNTIGGTAGLGILMDNANAFTLTITAPLKLGAAQTWRNNSGNLLTIGAGGVNTNAKALTIDGSGNTTISGVVSGTNSSGTVTKAGTGTLILSGANSYIGTTTVSAGVLNIQNATGLGTTAAGTTVSSGATLQIQGGITVGSEALTISGAGASGQTGALVNVSGTNNYGGLLTLSAATTIASNSGTLNLPNTGTITGATFGLTLTGSSDGTVSSIIGTTSGTLIKSGTGTWTLSGANTYTGTTTISQGTLSASTIVVSGGSSNLGNASSAVVLGDASNAGTLSYTGAAATYTRGFTVNAGGGRITNAGTGLLTIGTGGITNGGNLTFATNANGITVNSVISSTGSVTMNSSGPGALILAGANTYSSGTTLTAGTLQLSGSGTLGATSGTLTVNGGMLDLNGTNQSVGNFTGLGGTIVNNSTGTNKTLTIGTSNGTGGIYQGVIANHTSGTGTVALTKTGTGTITLSGGNTFTGNTTVSGGTLTLSTGSGNSALGSTGGITVNTGGTLLLGAIDQINNSATMTLNGGTFAKGNYSEGSTSAVGVGALTLSSGSHIDFGTGSVGILRFASLNAAIFTLTIDNWTGTANTMGSASADRLIFDSDQTLNLAIFSFTGYTNAVELALGGGFYEVVPLIPEPSTWLAGVLLSGALIYYQRRRGLRK